MPQDNLNCIFLKFAKGYSTQLYNRLKNTVLLFCHMYSLNTFIIWSSMTINTNCKYQSGCITQCVMTHHLMFFSECRQRRTNSQWEMFLIRYWTWYTRVIQPIWTSADGGAAQRTRTSKWSPERLTFSRVQLTPIGGSGCTGGWSPEVWSHPNLNQIKYLYMQQQLNYQRKLASESSLSQFHTY